MTIPIFLAEAIPLEIRNILKSLERGMKVRLGRGEEGHINFIGDSYIPVLMYMLESRPGTNFLRVCLTMYGKSLPGLKLNKDPAKIK